MNHEITCSVYGKSNKDSSIAYGTNDTVEENMGTHRLRPTID